MRKKITFLGKIIELHKIYKLTDPLKGIVTEESIQILAGILDGYIPDVSYDQLWNELEWLANSEGVERNGNRYSSTNYFRRLNSFLQNEYDFDLSGTGIYSYVFDNITTVTSKNTIYFEITDKIDWTPGKFFEAPSSCWWTYSNYSKGRTAFMYEMKQHRAFAMKLYTDPKRETPEGRAFIIRNGGSYYFFNYYHNTLNLYPFQYALTKYFAPKYSGRINFETDHDYLYINNNRAFYMSNRNEIKESKTLRHWAEDYDYNDEDIEEDRRQALLDSQGAFYCTDCREFADNVELSYVNVKGYGAVCGNCLDNHRWKRDHYGRIYFVDEEIEEE